MENYGRIFVSAPPYNKAPLRGTASQHVPLIVLLFIQWFAYVSQPSVNVLPLLYHSPNLLYARVIRHKGLSGVQNE